MNELAFQNWALWRPTANRPSLWLRRFHPLNQVQEQTAGSITNNHQARRPQPKQTTSSQQLEALALSAPTRASLSSLRTRTMRITTIFRAGRSR